MAIFRRRKNRTSSGAQVSDRQGNKADLDALRDFAESRRGVEAFIEPPTSVTQTTMILIAADGESMRRRVRSIDSCTALARKLQIPCYDVNRVGYPQRMRDYNLRQQGASSGAKGTSSGSAQSRAGATSSGSKSAGARTSGSGTPGRGAQRSHADAARGRMADGGDDVAGSSSPRSSAQSAAIMMLEKAAGVEPLPDDAGERQLQALLRKARAKAHPDRQDGDRSLWDRVEESARVLGVDKS